MELGRAAFAGAALAVIAAGYGLCHLIGNEYYFFAGYVILQFVVIATAWNILGGYAGYVNFGSAAFFAAGAYTTIALMKLAELPLLVTVPAAGVVAGLIGLGTGYLTLRLRNVYFAIATLALALVLETLIANWDFVGGAAGSFVLRPQTVPGFASYVTFLFWLMLILAVGAVVCARTIEHSRLGRGLAAIRDDEQAAECAGVPTLRLKLIATTISGALMGLAGAPFPYYITFVDPPSVFSLDIAVNAVAMPMVGGAGTWFGPVVGALLLATLQQVATVTISSELNLLIVGVTLVAFVIAAPGGLVSLWRTLATRIRGR